jgi:ribosomal protein S18 acetylase RimI-like enzyme
MNPSSATTAAEAVEFRLATRDDIPQLAMLKDNATKWLAAHGRTDQWGDGTVSSLENPHTLSRIDLMLASGGCWLALDATRSGDDEVVIGALSVGPAWDYVPPAAEPELYVQFLITDRSWKGHGLGKILVDKARSLAREAGVSVLRVDCYGGGDGKLVKWYESAGFTKVQTILVQDKWPGQILMMRLPNPE